MVNLVEYIKGEPRTTSDLVAREFGIAHKDILTKLSNLMAEISAVKFSEMYTKTTRTVRGREFPIYTVNRDGYMFLVMNISTKKAHNKKLAFIDAFNLMEKALLQHGVNNKSPEWARVRLQSKEIRLQQTDVIKEFVDYAESQGSKGAKWYYKHITNATYKALQLIQHNKPKIREVLDCMELSQLMVAENVAKKSIRKHMDSGEHYKVVFELVKRDLELYGSSLMIEKE